MLEVFSVSCILVRPFTQNVIVMVEFASERLHFNFGLLLKYSCLFLFDKINELLLKQIGAAGRLTNSAFYSLNLSLL